MAGSFSQLYIQIVFAVKGRDSLIHSSWEEELFKYISGIINRKEQKMLAINGMPDHIHILIGMKPSCCLSDLIREIKKASTEFITNKKFTRFKFQWQIGYGAFSYNQSCLNNVIAYINNQKNHHTKRTFKDEYTDLLKKFQIDFKDAFLFEWINTEHNNEQFHQTRINPLQSSIDASGTWPEGTGKI